MLDAPGRSTKFICAFIISNELICIQSDIPPACNHAYTQKSRRGGGEPPWSAAGVAVGAGIAVGAAVAGQDGTGRDGTRQERKGQDRATGRDRVGN